MHTVTEDGAAAHWITHKPHTAWEETHLDMSQKTFSVLEHADRTEACLYWHVQHS